MLQKKFSFVIILQHCVCDCFILIYFMNSLIDYIKYWFMYLFFLFEKMEEIKGQFNHIQATLKWSTTGTVHFDCYFLFVFKYITL